MAAIIDLTDEDDVIHVDSEQATEDTVTSNITLNSSEHDNEKAVPVDKDASYKDHVEIMKETAIGTLKKHVASKYPAICDKPNQPRHFRVRVSVL